MITPWILQGLTFSLLESTLELMITWSGLGVKAAEPIYERASSADSRSGGWLLVKDIVEVLGEGGQTL